MLWTVFVVILVLWLLGFSFHVAGGLIHILLVIALIVLSLQSAVGATTHYRIVPSPTQPSSERSIKIEKLTRG